MHSMLAACAAAVSLVLPRAPALLRCVAVNTARRSSHSSLSIDSAARPPAPPAPPAPPTPQPSLSPGIDVLPSREVASLPTRWLVFSDLHVRQETLPLCLQLLGTVAAEARARDAGVICLGDFWHSGAMLSTRQLNAVLAEISGWGDDLLMLMIPGNHDQAMRGNPAAALHALTPLQRAAPERIRVFSRPTLVGDSLWLPYGVEAEGVRRACAEAAVHRAAATAATAAAAPWASGSSGLAAVFCHADIVGAMMNDGFAAAVGVPPDAFPPPPTLVYSGHYHKPHEVAARAARGRSIRYVGSPYQMGMGEAGQRKSLLLLDAAAGWRVAEELPLQLGPQHHKLLAPTAEHLSELLPRLRRGDRVMLVGEPDAPPTQQFAVAARDIGAAVDVRPQLPVPRAAVGDADSDAAAAIASQPDYQRPAALFASYAVAHNLSETVRAAGGALLRECEGAGEISPMAAVTLSLDRVELEGFGSFADRTEYELHRRGLVLLQGATPGAEPAAPRTSDGPALLDEGVVEGGSNGAGKTTLAMAPLWALTGSTDARASGKPVELRGVIHDRCERAWVRLSGRLLSGKGNPADAGAEDGSVPFIVTRTLGRRGHRLEFAVGDEVHSGTLQQVQEALEHRLRASSVARVAFFGQHASGGLLDKSDAVFKAELQHLLPIGQWETLRAAAKTEAAAARDAAARADGELSAHEALATSAAAEAKRFVAEAEAWASARAERLAEHDTKTAELQASADEASVEVCDAALSMARDAVATIAQELSVLRKRRDSAVAASHAACEEARHQERRAADDADAANAELAHAKSHAAVARHQAETATAAAADRLGWGAERWTAAVELLQEGLDAVRGLLRDAVEGAHLASREHSDTQLPSGGLAEAVLGHSVFEGQGPPVADASPLVAAAEIHIEALERDQLQAQANALAASQRLDEARSQLIRTVSKERGTSVAAGQGRERIGGLRSADSQLQAANSECDEPHPSLEEISATDRTPFVCSSCGQPVSEEAVATRVADLSADASTAADTLSELKRRVHTVRLAMDSYRLHELRQRAKALRRAAAASDAKEASSEAQLLEKRKALVVARALVASAETKLRALEAQINAEATALEEKQRDAAAELDACAARKQRAVLQELRLEQAEAQRAEVESADNPHEQRVKEVRKRQQLLANRTSALKTVAAASREREGHMEELAEHFGKRGIQTLLYSLALSHLERSAAVYIGQLSSGRLRLELSFDEAQRLVRKEVLVACGDGTTRRRSVSQLSGGEWRRVSLGLALALADFAKLRAALSCNLLVLDEVMQHMDTEGQRAMAQVLTAFNEVDTVIVIAHGLRTDSLYGLFDEVDTVSKMEDVSRVLRGVADMSG